MTEHEWLQLGYQNHIIDSFDTTDLRLFKDVFADWFRTKIKKCQASSVDRIENTYNKYYRGSELVNMYVQRINEQIVIDFITGIMICEPVTTKERSRIYQIVNNVMCFCLDMDIPGVSVLNWDKIHRCADSTDISSRDKVEYAVSDNDIALLYDSVVNKQIYVVKQCTSLLLVMNFWLGLRVGELASLQFSQFDLSNKLVKVAQNFTKHFDRDDSGERVGSMRCEVTDSLKTVHSYRFVPLCNESIYLYELIKKRHEDMEYKSPFLAYDGVDNVLYWQVMRVLSKLCKLCEIEHINSHRIRKTYASKLHMAGIPTKQISDLLGHSDMSTTERCYILNYEYYSDDIRKQISDALKVK